MESGGPSIIVKINPGCSDFVPTTTDHTQTLVRMEKTKGEEEKNCYGEGRQKEVNNVPEVSK